MNRWITSDKLLRDLKPALALFNNACNTLDIPERVRKNALDLYTKLIINDLTRGRKRSDLLSACVYLSCNENNYPISIKELSKAFENSSIKLIQSMKYVKKHFNTQGCITPEDYINKYAYLMKLSEKDKTRTLNELIKTKEILINKSSNAIAAVTLYYTNSKETSIRAIEKLTNVSRTQLSNCLKILKNTKH